MNSYTKPNQEKKLKQANKTVRLKLRTNLRAGTAYDPKHHHRDQNSPLYISFDNE